MHAKRQSSSETTHVIEATIGHLREKFSSRFHEARERILRAQRLIRETPRSLIEIALEVGYMSPSYFAQVFRRTAGMAPTEFRNALAE